MYMAEDKSEIMNDILARYDKAITSMDDLLRKVKIRKFTRIRI